MQAYKFFIAFTLCIVTSHVALKAQIESYIHCDTLITIDSTQVAKQSRIELKNLAAPVALIATGSILALDYKHGVNKTVNGWFKDNSSQFKIDRYMHVLPSAQGGSQGRAAWQFRAPLFSIGPHDHCLYRCRIVEAGIWQHAWMGWVCRCLGRGFSACLQQQALVG